MFFSRKKNKASEAERRVAYRSLLPEDHPLRMFIRRSDESIIETELIDLTISGASFRLLEQYPAEFQVDEMFDVAISIGAGLEVHTPAVARRDVSGPGGIEWGVEFINIGNLYGQWDNILGQYFNRRTRVRVGIDLDRPLSASLASHGAKMLATVYDLTIHGVGLLVSHIEAGPLKLEADARVTIRLPDSKKEIMGWASIRQHRRFDQRDVIGLRFDLSDPEGFAKHEAVIAEYCTEREQELTQWEEGWSEENVA
jgi:c-di-GMP-binding flagellar brake protein YcgR